jgi:drug/metabolite transporter (DMT)-like permease
MQKSPMPPRAAAGDNVKLAVAVILATNLALSLGDAAIKHISANFVLWQIFVLRSLIAMPVLIAVIRLRYPALALAPRRLGWVALRSLLLTSMWVAYCLALTRLALGIVAAAYYTLPIFITLFAAFFIGERISRLGWAAVFLGFAGVLLILKPQASGFNAYALLPLASAIFDALAMILTRTKCREEHPLVLSLSLNVSFVAVGLLATLLIATVGVPAGTTGSASFLPGGWTAMAMSEWLAMALLAGAIIVGSVGAAIAYQVGPPATVATFDFAYVGFASVWGVLFFAEVPDGITIAGIGLIVVAGVLAVRR